eukprot:CAMPEP_0168743594 /NCGR_PEP_ID=MMETSP0724-20121128/13657_1 /TAXON_ID=265536 /ORGANISM="Amphiprora sp., Strain CCMP467" /LENGTH=757 /DNA_ID=CAMNT_0008791229 /DNA_START=83 /DNA_END=2356 /DNA_ORIENTATION=-
MRLALFSGFVLILFITSLPPFYRKNGYTYHTIGRTRPLYSPSSVTVSDTVSTLASSSSSSSKKKKLRKYQGQPQNDVKRHDLLDAAGPVRTNYEPATINEDDIEDNVDDDSTLMLAKHYHQIEQTDPEHAYVSTVTSHRYSQPIASSRHDMQESTSTTSESESTENENVSDDTEMNQNDRASSAKSNTLSDVDEMLIRQRPPAPQSSFSCKPRLPSRAQTRTPLLVFSAGGSSSGAHVFFDTLLHQVSLPPRSEKGQNNHPFYRKHAEHVDLMNFQHLFAAALPGESGTSVVASNAMGSYLWDTALALSKNCLDTDLNTLQDTMQTQWLSTRVGISKTSTSSSSSSDGSSAASWSKTITNSGNKLRGVWRRKSQTKEDEESSHEHHSAHSMSSSSPQIETLHFLRQQGDKRPNIAKMVSLFESRRYSMVNTLQYLHQLPYLASNQNTKPTLAIHLSDEILKASKVEPDALVGLLHEQFSVDEEVDDEDNGDEVEVPDQPIHFVILWHRCLIETFVYLEVAAMKEAKHNEFGLHRRLSEVPDDGISSLLDGKETLSTMDVPIAVNQTKVELPSKGNDPANHFTQQEQQEEHQSSTHQKSQEEHQSSKQQTHHEHQSFIGWPTKRAQSPSDLLEVDHDRLQKFIKDTKKFYSSLRNQLEALGIQYHVFEYERDFSTAKGMMQSTLRVQELLGLGRHAGNSGDATQQAQQIVEAWSKKQQHTHRRQPLHRLVNNWDDVVEWGLGSTQAQDWEDLFAGHQE